MATTLTGSLRADISVKYNSGDASLSNDQMQAIEAFSMNFTNGTGSGQADLFFSVNVPALGTSATDSYDLDAGTMTDPNGVAITFANIVGLIIVHKSGSSSSSIILGGDWLTTHNIGTNLITPGNQMLVTNSAEYVVTATSADVLTVTNSDGSNTANYDLYLIGKSA